MGLATGGYKPNTCINILTAARFAKKPMIATEIKRINCLDGFDFDSWNTKYFVITKFTTTPKKVI